MNDFYFLIIPERGDSVRSVLNYPTAKQARNVGKELARSILKPSEWMVSNTAFIEIKSQPQKYLNVAVIAESTKQVQSDNRIRA